jgi:hypothetical protein
VFQFRSTIEKEENFMVKSLLIGLAALLVLATGATAAESKQSKNPLRPGNVNRLCVWVEQGGTPDTAWDIKAVKAYTATHKVCIVGKAGKNGKNGKNGKAGAKGAQGLMGTPGAQGLQGIAGLAGKDGTNGEAGAQGEQGLSGENGLDGENGSDGLDGADGDNGLDGADGDDGQDGDDGDDGISVTSAVEPPGANCAAGGSSFTAANGVTYACNGAKGDKGDPGQDGQDGQDGQNGQDGQDGEDGSITGIITVEGSFEPGEKTIIVNCDPGFKAVSGGYDIQGSVTASYRSDNAGDPDGDTSWTVTQTSGNTGSGKAYVYCAAVA